MCVLKPGLWKLSARPQRAGVRPLDANRCLQIRNQAAPRLMCIRQLGKIDTLDLPGSYMNNCHKHAFCGFGKTSRVPQRCLSTGVKKAGRLVR